jgi:hypothetical protein
MSHLPHPVDANAKTEPLFRQSDAKKALLWVLGAVLLVVAIPYGIWTVSELRSHDNRLVRVETRADLHDRQEQESEARRAKEIEAIHSSLRRIEDKLDGMRTRSIP